jgi:hypothetical protein
MRVMDTVKILVLCEDFLYAAIFRGGCVHRISGRKAVLTPRNHGKQLNIITILKRLVLSDQSAVANDKHRLWVDAKALAQISSATTKRQLLCALLTLDKHLHTG